MRAIHRLLLSVQKFFIGGHSNPMRGLWMFLAFTVLLAVIMAAAFHFMWKSLQW
jgi:hypothetical protein